MAKLSTFIDFTHNITEAKAAVDGYGNWFTKKVVVASLAVRILAYRDRYDDVSYDLESIHWNGQEVTDLLRAVEYLQNSTIDEEATSYAEGYFANLVPETGPGGYHHNPFAL